MYSNLKTSYSIIKENNKELRYKKEISINQFERTYDGYKVTNSQMKEIFDTFEMKDVENVAFDEPYDYIELNNELFDAERLNECVSFIDTFAQKEDVLYFFKWEILIKKTQNDYKKHVVISGTLDLALLVNGYRKESIYCFSRDYNSFLKKIIKSIDKIELIKSFNPQYVLKRDTKYLLSEQTAAILMHEAVGHLSEADLLLSNKKIMKTYLQDKKITNAEITVIDDGRVRSSGWTPIDDEGERGRETILVKNGMSTGILHNLYTAQKFNQKTTGNMRINPIAGSPQVRMTNTYVKKGKDALELYKNLSEGVIYIDNLRACYGFFDIYIEPGRCYYYSNGKKQDILMENKCISARKIMQGIIGIGNNFEVIESTLTGCKKGGGLLPVSIASPQLLLSADTFTQ